MNLNYEECLFDVDISPARELLRLLLERVYKRFDGQYTSPATVARGLFRRSLKKRIGSFLGYPYTVDPYLVFAYELLSTIAEPVVIDVGACMGTTVLPIAKKVPSAKVFAVEPNGYNLARLITNQQLNRLTNIVSLAAAVGSITGEFLEIGQDNSNEGGHRVLHAKDSLQGSRFFAPRVSLAQIFKFFKLTHCDLLKIDTEGFDYHVLESLGELADPKIVQQIVVECNPPRLEENGKSAWDLACFGLERGYRCSLLHNQKPITSETDIPPLPPHHVLDFLFTN